MSTPETTETVTIAEGTPSASRDDDIRRMLESARPTLGAMSCGIVLSLRKLRILGASDALIGELQRDYGMSE